MIRVTIERHCKPGKGVELEKLLIDLRVTALNYYGYVSGETLKSVDDPEHWLVISSWTDIDHWKAWEASQDRKELSKKLEPLLAAPEKVTVFAFMRKGGGASAHVIDK